MVQVYFPSMFMRLVNLNMAQGRAVLRVPPSMTKTEVKEYLTKIYNIPVIKVSTENVLGLKIYYYLFLNNFKNSKLYQEVGKDFMVREKFYLTDEGTSKMHLLNLIE